MDASFKELLVKIKKSKYHIRNHHFLKTLVLFWTIIIIAPKHSILQKQFNICDAAASIHR